MNYFTWSLCANQKSTKFYILLRIFQADQFALVFNSIHWASAMILLLTPRTITSCSKSRISGTHQTFSTCTAHMGTVCVWTSKNLHWQCTGTEKKKTKKKKKKEHVFRKTQMYDSFNWDWSQQKLWKGKWGHVWSEFLENAVARLTISFGMYEKFFFFFMGNGKTTLLRNF